MVGFSSSSMAILYTSSTANQGERVQKRRVSMTSSTDKRARTIRRSVSAEQRLDITEPLLPNNLKTKTKGCFTYLYLVEICRRFRDPNLLHNQLALKALLYSCFHLQTSSSHQTNPLAVHPNPPISFR